MSSQVDLYIDDLLPNQKAIAIQLRSIIHALVPGVQEKFSFKIPFYHYFGMFCYINPVKDGVDLGICNGKDIAANFASLEVKGRAIVATVRLHSVKEITQKQVEQIIAAAAIEKELTKSKKLNK